MKLAFALLLTASLHAQIVVINPTDNGAVSLNKINANFAYLDLHGGGGTVTGSSAQVLVNGGSPGSCSTGTCTVSLAGPIYFNPVPGVYSGITIGPYVGSGAYAASLTVGVPTGATTNLAAAFGGGVAIGAASGNANAISNFVPTGLTQTFVEPTVPNVSPSNVSGSNLQTPYSTTVTVGGLFNPAAYGNVAGMVYTTQVLNGMNSNDNSNKDTMFGEEFNTTFNGSGQKYGLAVGATGYGAGDLFGTNFGVFYNNRSNAYGDEGTKVIDVYLQQQWNTTPQSSITVTATACGATSLNASVAASGSPTDIKTVAVNGTLTSCHAGDWLVVDGGTFAGWTGGGSCPTGSASGTNYCQEAVQLTAVGSSTISALFHLGHSSGAPLAPSPVIAVSPTSAPTWGQNSIVVDSAVTYSTGTAYVSAQSLTYPFATVTGIGTTWTSITNSGTNLQYCISFSGDNFTAGSNPNQQAWYPIASIVSDTSLYIGYYPGGYTGSVLTSGGATSYSISQCGEILEMPVSYGSTANTIAGLAMNANPNGWTNGHNVYQIISPVAVPTGAVEAQYWHYGPSSSTPDFFVGSVLGGAPAHSLLTGLGAPLSSTLAAYGVGIVLPSTQNGGIQMGQIDMSGLALDLTTSATTIPRGPHSAPATTGDVKAYHWSGDGAHDELWLHPGTTGTGLVVHTASGNTPALTFMEDTAVVGTVQAPGGISYDWNLPPQSGAIFVSQGGSGIARTLPSSTTETIPIGSLVLGGYNEYSVELWIMSGTGNNQSARYQVTAWCCAGTPWRIVAPVSTEFDNATFQLEAQNSTAAGGTLNFRLRPIAGTGQSTWTTVIAVGNPNIVWTPDTSAASVTTAPTAYWDSAFMTQTGNKLTLNYTSTASATIDPTGLTAARALTLPDVDGTPGVFPASTVVNSAVCIKSASPLSLGYCSSVVGVGGTCTCN